MKKILAVIILMLCTIKIAAQSSFGLSGYWGSAPRSSSLLNSFENNISNYSYLKDWGITINYGEEFSKSASSNLYSLTLSKKIDRSIFSIRYTPGYQKEFTIGNPVTIISDTNNTNQSLNSSFMYKELFGLQYSYNISEKLGAGLALRFYNQEFTREILNSVFNVDTVYLETKSENEKLNTLKGDIGINYYLNNNFSFSLTTLNLWEFNSNNSLSPEAENYKLRSDKGASIGISFTPLSSFSLNLDYETTSSFQISLNSDAIFSNSIGFGISLFHDKYQSPFISGIIPSLNFISKSFAVSISAVKYFSARSSSGSFPYFESEGIHNIINNRYSYDKALATLSFILNTLPEKEFEFLGVDILQDIYPALTDNYINNPFAAGKVVNLTDKAITVKPACRIEGISQERFQSPLIKIGAKDTAEVPFYIIIPDNYTGNKPEISYADFFITSANEDPGSQLQKPALINGINAWDGKVINLRYFIKKDLGYSMTYCKNLLSEYKGKLDTVPYPLSIFYKAEIIFNEVIKQMVYSSDPRASADYVQFPKETINLKGGDCDDLSVLYSSLLESIGIQTALVDYKPDSLIGHVNVMFNTELSPGQAGLITNNDNKFFIRKNEKGVNEVWLVIETTSLTDFNTAWKLGMGKFNKEAVDDLGLAKGKVAIVDVY